MHKGREVYRIPKLKAKCITSKPQRQQIQLEWTNRPPCFLSPGVALDSSYTFLPMVSLQPFLNEKLTCKFADK
jgi:hypothetical protein